MTKKNTQPVAEPVEPTINAESTKVEEPKTDPLDITEPEDVVIPSKADVKKDDADAHESDAGDEGAKGNGAAEFGDDLLKRASELGLNEKEAKSIGDPKSLERVLDAFEANIEKGRRPTERKTPAVEKFALTLDPDVYDAGLIEQINLMNDHYATQSQKLTDEIHAWRGEQERLSKDARTDGYFKELGTDFEELFGSGPGSDLASRSAHARNRIKVKDEVDALIAGYSATGKTVPPEGELFKRAVRGIFGQHEQDIERRKTSEKLRQANGQFVSRPTHRNGSPLSPEQQAIQSVTALMAEREISAFGDREQFE